MDRGHDEQDLWEIIDFYDSEEESPEEHLERCGGCTVCLEEGMHG
jgi:hypothetical protein